MVVFNLLATAEMYVTCSFTRKARLVFDVMTCLVRCKSLPFVRNRTGRQIEIYSNLVWKTCCNIFRESEYLSVKEIFISTQFYMKYSLNIAERFICEQQFCNA